MSTDDNAPRSDPYSDTYPNYGHIPIPPPPPGFQSEPTVPPHFGLMPTAKASLPPRSTPPKGPKKRRREISPRRAIALYGAIVIGAIIAIIIGSSIVNNQPHWTFFHTYDSYYTSHVAEALAVPRTWRIAWQCTQDSGSTPFVIDIYDGNGAPLYPGLVRVNCQNGTQRGFTGALPPGNIIVDIRSLAVWTADIQEQTQ